MINEDPNPNLDCVLFAFEGKRYLIPDVSVKQAVVSQVLPKKSISDEFYLTELKWGTNLIPLVTPLMDKLDVTTLIHKKAKCVILHAIYPKNFGLTEFFALPFDGILHKLTVNPDDLSWENQQNHQAKLGKSPKSAMSITILPILQICQKISDFYQ